MAPRFVSPNVNETAFNCPHCGALAKQFWYSACAQENEEDSPLPLVITKDDKETYDSIENETFRKSLIEWRENMKTGLPHLAYYKDGVYCRHRLNNVHLSKCYNCEDISIWHYDQLVYPRQGEAPPANVDLPDAIKRDYQEASSILDLSPRGAAALVRLCIQKLCKELGQTGKNINDDIAALVKSGLDSRVQKALDAVRVIGNSAVHPGSIDLRDDRATAYTLFRLLNLIAEKMISEPKHVDEVYSALPPGALAAIKQRDKKTS